MNGVEPPNDLNESKDMMQVPPEEDGAQNYSSIE